MLADIDVEVGDVPNFPEIDPLISACHAWCIGEAKEACDLILKHRGKILSIIVSPYHRDIREIWYAVPESSLGPLYSMMMKRGLVHSRNES